MRGTEKENDKKSAEHKQAVNPYLPPWEYIPDGEPYVFGDRVYIYGSHDFYNGYVFCMGDYVCWSAPVDDLGNWRYEGVIYPRNADPLNKEGKMCLYAPDITVGPDGRYYLYYVLDKVSVVSVAVCDTPAGKYSFYGYVHYQDGTRLGEKEGDQPQFDPGVLTEGNTTYLYTGFCSRGDKSRNGAMLTVLGADMLTVEKAPVFVVPGCEYSAGTGFEGHEFFEAPSIRKAGETYYFIYSSIVMHELCYAVSKEPDRGFVYGGVIVSNCDLHIDTYKPADKPMAYGANNHGSIVEINGEWYIFYHRHTNGTWYSRQGCAEKLEILPDGSIPQVEITSCGLNGGPLAGEGEYGAYLACHLFTEEDSVYVGDDRFPKIMQDGRDGDEEPGYIANMKDGATAGFKYFDCKNIIGISVKARGYMNGYFEVRTKWDGDVLTKIPVCNANVWETFDAPVVIPDGKQAVYLTYRGRDKASLLSFTLKTRKYRNAFAEAGYQPAEIEKRLEEIFQTMFYGKEDERIYHPVGSDMGYLTDTGNNDVRTEGMSYGMMMCVQLDRKEEFDRIWKWTKTYMYLEDGSNKGYFAWSCQTDGTKNSYGPAPDGEEYFAMALFFASHRWGDGEGIFHYSEEARAILRACLHQGEDGNGGQPMWEPSNKLIKFIPDCDWSDPSYHLPHFYELFSMWADEADSAFWKEAARASREYLKKACHPETGLAAEYAEYDGTPHNKDYDRFGGRHDWFYSDAYRVAANIGLDYAWFAADSWEKECADKIQRFFAPQLEEQDYRIYETDGTVLPEKALHPVAMIATNAQASLASEGEYAAAYVRKFWETPLRKGDRRYYDNCLYLFAFLALSGNYRVY